MALSEDARSRPLLFRVWCAILADPDDRRRVLVDGSPQLRPHRVPNEIGESILSVGIKDRTKKEAVQIFFPGWTGRKRTHGIMLPWPNLNLPLFFRPFPSKPACRFVVTSHERHAPPTLASIFVSISSCCTAGAVVCRPLSRRERLEQRPIHAKG